MTKAPDALCNDHAKSNPMFSLATCLGLAWRSLAELHNSTTETTSVAFKDINFKKYFTKINEKKLQVTILPGSGNFEISKGEEIIVDGNIKIIHDVNTEKITLPIKSIEKQCLDTKDIYTELTKRGYNDTDSKRCINSSDIEATVGYIAWMDWSSFINAILQFSVLEKNTKKLYLPKSIDTIVIDSKCHTLAVLKNQDVPVFNYKDMKVIVAGGVQIIGIKWELVSREIKQLDFEMYSVNEKLKKVHGMKKEVENIYLECSPGDLSSLRWVQSPRLVPRSDMELCHVYFASLNHQDLVFASGTGLLDESLVQPLGIEFSGRTTSGKRVMGIVHQALATAVLADKRFLWEVPPNWSLDKAATVPVAFCTAYYALFVRAQIRPNQTVVVYHGSSDIGFAAIKLATHSGCTVFSTYGTNDQRQMISSVFLEVPDKHNGFHWDPTFEKNVLERTGGKGADIILNLLGSEKVPAALTCLADGGTFLQVENNFRDNVGRATSAALAPNKSIHTINMNTVTEAESLIVADLLEEGIKRGDVYPMMMTNIFSFEHVKEAFDWCARSSDILGKVVIRMRQEESPGEQMTKRTILATPRSYMDGDKTYVLIGGPGELTMELGDWLISRGTTKMVISQHSDISGYQSRCIKRWVDRGINVIISAQDPSTQEGARHLLEEATSLGEIGGVFDLSAVLQEGNMISKELEVKSKIEEIKLLERTTCQLAPSLDYFVVFSSITDQRLSDALDKVVQRRKKEKMSGTVIRLATVDSKENVKSYKLISEDRLPDIRAVIHSLDDLLIQPYNIVPCSTASYA